MEEELYVLRATSTARCAIARKKPACSPGTHHDPPAHRSQTEARLGLIVQPSHRHPEAWMQARGPARRASLRAAGTPRRPEPTRTTARRAVRPVERAILHR